MKIELLSQNAEFQLIDDRQDMITLAQEPDVFGHGVLVYLPPTASVQQLVEVLRWPADYDLAEEAPFVESDAAGIAFRVRCAREYIIDLVDTVQAAKGGFLR
jgi:hypothetical protein